MPAPLDLDAHAARIARDGYTILEHVVALGLVAALGDEALRLRTATAGRTR